MSKSDLAPPSYEATIANNDTTTSYQQGIPQTQSQLIHARLTTVRTQHINDIITTHILPLIHLRASAGMSRTSIALVPLLDTADSDSNSDSARNLVIDIVSGTCKDDDGLALVQLSQPAAALGFWSPESTVEQLRATLVQRLTSSDEMIEKELMLKKGDSLVVTEPPSSSSSSALRQSRTRRFLFRRTSSQPRSNEALPVGATGHASDKQERVTINVEPEEICLRTVSDFGLYETLTRPALIVRIIIHG